MHRCTANVKNIVLLSNKCLNVWDPTAEGESVCIFMCTAELGFFQVLYHLKVINNEGRHSTHQQKGENPKWPPRWPPKKTMISRLTVYSGVWGVWGGETMCIKGGDAGL